MTPMISTMRVLRSRCLLGAVLACGACSTDKSFGPSRDEHTLLQTVRLSERVYNMATVPPYDTAQLHVTATMADGTPATDVNVVYSTNSTKFIVDSAGVLHANTEVSNGVVYASVTVNGQTVSDSARVSVITGVPTLIDSVSIPDFYRFTTDGVVPWNHTFQLVWPDIGTVTADGIPVAFDVLGNPSSSVVVEMHSSDTTVVSVTNPGWISNVFSFTATAVSPGQAWLYASAYAYGKTFRDSALITVKPSLLYHVFAERFTRPDGSFRYIFDPDSIVVPPGSDVSWHNRMPPDECAQGFCSSSTVEVTFDEPQHALGSRIPAGINQTDGLTYFLTSSLNEHGGNGDIPPFRTIIPDASGTGQCAFAPPYNCFKGSEARRVNTPGVYRYHSAQGATGVIVVQ